MSTESVHDDKISRLLFLLEKFRVIKNEDGTEYTVKRNNAMSYLSATIMNNEITYWMNGICKYHLNYKEIDMNELMELKEFCEVLIK